MAIPTLPKPAPCPVEPENIPGEMKARDQWVNWRWTWRNATKKRAGKWDKPPIDARTGRPASSTDPETWSPFEVAYAAYLDPKNGYDGVGYVFSGDEGDFVGTDLDKCRDPVTGELRPWSEEQRACKHWQETAPEPNQIIELLATYTEVSPSQTGVKLVVRGTIAKGMKHGSVEIYRIGRYFTVTGHRLPDAPAQINECVALDEVFRQFDALRKDVKPRRQGARLTGAVPPHSQTKIDSATVDQVLAGCQNAANEAKFSRLFAGDIQGYPSQSEAELALCGIVAFWSEGDARLIDQVYRQSKLFRPKWDEARGSQTYGQRTIAVALEGCTAYFDWTTNDDPKAVFSIGNLVLVIKDVIKTATKLCVALEVQRDGRPIDRLKFTDATSSRQDLTKQLEQQLDDEELGRECIGETLGAVLVESERMASQRGEVKGQRLYGILAEYVQGQIQLLYSLEGGKACCAPSEEVITRPMFVERFLTDTVLQLAATASDAPRDKYGNVKRLALAAAVERELKVLWGELHASLRRLDDAEIAEDSRAAVEFRQALIAIWTKPASMGLHRQRIESGSAKGESVQLATRNSLATRVHRLLVESFEALSSRWVTVQEGFEAYVRQQPGQTPGELRTLLAMRYELAAQIGVSVPGVANQTGLQRLGRKFKAVATDPAVPDRMTGGERLVVLSSTLVGKILALPDESLVKERSASDSCAPDEGPREGGANVTNQAQNSSPVTIQDDGNCHSVTE